MLQRLPISRLINATTRSTSPLSNITRTYATMTDTSKYKLNHTMLRIKDPKATSDYYCGVLGMKQINKVEFPESKFDLYFFGYDSPKAVSSGKHWTDREGLIEVTHNYGTENDGNFQIANGNNEPGKGYGHTCISVDNIQAACQRISDAGYKFQKKLSDGRMNNIAFALDPDSYWVEIIGQKPVKDTEGVKETDPGAYRMNHSMIRVKDKAKSIKFYEDIMGMKKKREQELKGADATVIFLGYGPPAPDDSPNDVNPLADHEGLLELTHNHGTENDSDFSYHDGNSDPKGFGHICISVDDLDKACERFEQKGVTFKKKLTDGNMKDIAFVLDPDGYWIEVIQNEALKKRVGW